MRKSVNLLIILLFFISVVISVDYNASAGTDIEFNYEDYSYRVLDDYTIEITGYHGTETSITIPSEVDIFLVMSIGSYAFDQNKDITEITIPDGVTNIGDRAFTGMTSLKKIYFPDSIKTIGEDIFNGCKNVNIYYAGSKNDWAEIESHSLIYSSIHFNNINTGIIGYIVFTVVLAFGIVFLSMRIIENIYDPKKHAFLTTELYDKRCNKILDYIDSHYD